MRRLFSTIVTRQLGQRKTLHQTEHKVGRTFLVWMSIPILTLLSTGIPLVVPQAMALPTSAFPTGQWVTKLGNTIHSDDTQSVKLPNGKILWAFGDTTQINGKSTVFSLGFPHQAFVLQTPKTLKFTPHHGPFGFTWQQVPNWSDNSYFWMTSPVVDKGTLYVLGMRINHSGAQVGTYVALFNASSLKYERIVPLPGGPTGKTAWNGIVKGPHGWYVAGTHPVPCKKGAQLPTDCRSGDIASVPFGDLGQKSKWDVHANVVSKALDLDNTLAITKVSSSNWVIFVKVGGPFSTNSIERLTASSVFGPWKQSGTWNAPAPQGSQTYNVAVHPEQAAPSGDVLVSYNVNGGNAKNYHPLFLYLPLK